MTRTERFKAGSISSSSVLLRGSVWESVQRQFELHVPVKPPLSYQRCSRRYGLRSISFVD
ncbi:hypothetical protein GN244_ATG15017 [Phytophthora infestans]|uniref:Uncharacterized protein n=1 Tax=Phytophthora infestans TaxID=4787 RepID=A0A833SEW9_PHYIN|nr:hypothetical protein GN244_ATG18951 [Phytophthora infestans]KAF4033130.1 hypothetical protein GN244_ATG15017 [Phytophthora infestans]